MICHRVIEIALLLTGILIVLVASPVQAGGPGHEILEAMGIDGADLPPQVWLVRSPVDPVDLVGEAGLRVHGRSRDVSLVSGDANVIAALSARGCFVVEWEAVVAAEIPQREYSAPKAADPQIQAFVDELTWPTYSGHIQWLADFGSRYSYSPNCAVVADSLHAHFADLGLGVAFHDFTYNATAMRNVVATQTGAVCPDSIFVLCAHYDATSEDPHNSTPGADDNGTGTATVMAAAQILSQHSFAYTIRYICFAGEEQGLRGSTEYAADAAAAGDAIIGALNYDMMGYWEAGVEADLEIECNRASRWLADTVVGAAGLYTGAAWELHVDESAWWGDHYPFWTNGFAAVNHEEAWDWGDPDFNPYYHSTLDVLAYIGEDFALSNAKVAVASLAVLAQFQPRAGVGDPLPAADAMQLTAWPNPFNGSVRISAAAATGISSLDLEIFDLRGRLVTSLPVSLEDGRGAVDWKARDRQGREVEAGVYFCRPRNGGAAARISYVK